MLPEREPTSEDNEPTIYDMADGPGFWFAVKVALVGSALGLLWVILAYLFRLIHT